MKEFIGTITFPPTGAIDGNPYRRRFLYNQDKEAE